MYVVVAVESLANDKQLFINKPEATELFRNSNSITRVALLCYVKGI